MKETVKCFMPSLVRGVYRFDERLSKIKTKDEARNFIETKLKFLPEHIINLISEFTAPSATDFSNTIARHRISISSNSQVHTSNQQRYLQYFASYNYFSNQIERSEGEQNYLEAEFVRRILSPILCTEGLLKINPQTEIDGYFADFTLAAGKKYVFEVDGFLKFNSRSDLDNCWNRQNVISRAGWSVLRYGYTSIMQNADYTRRQLWNIFQADLKMRQFLIDDPSRNNECMGGDLFAFTNDWNAPAESGTDIIDLVNDYYLTQDFIAHQLILQRSFCFSCN